MKTKTFWIVPGFAEGRWHMHHMERAMLQAGFVNAASAESAHILIAHSGGCYLLPAITKQKVFLIGPPYWPGRSLVSSFLSKMHQDFVYCFTHGRIVYWLTKTGWNIVYLARDILLALVMSLRVGKRGLPALIANHDVTIIQNQEDAWCSPLALDLTSQSHSLPGQHDDCWYNPQPYVKIIEKHHGLLA